MNGFSRLLLASLLLDKRRYANTVDNCFFFFLFFLSTKVTRDYVVNSGGVFLARKSGNSRKGFTEVFEYQRNREGRQEGCQQLKMASISD